MQCLSRKEDRECKNILCPFPVGGCYFLLDLKLSFRVQSIKLGTFFVIKPSLYAYSDIKDGDR